MTRCLTCSTELERDHIGGSNTPRNPSPPRAVLLCPRCWTVYPADRHLVAVSERRDLA